MGRRKKNIKAVQETFGSMWGRIEEKIRVPLTEPIFCQRIATSHDVGVHLGVF
ncbi:hypothetical protein FEMY_12650 [Ferrovum myxofaciens]|jgi:hypothetical protein|uniref:Uncharacterized protein n=1 Tax=Ferrovum myxofaciens TaxID=416213 RepID=A0A149VYA4_9PROT|nr:hypothetical protein FEMY_12650 [Ferrovum myxofaciens]